jgi:DNA-directed RNA polymerase specialized sigma24 family protein
MKIPSNMTYDEVINVITKVVNKTAPKYTFYGYTIDDIKQESFIICVEALERYDSVRPLENFLSVNLSNRLKNFIRDNHFLSNTHNQRIKVLQPAQLDYEETLLDEDEKYAIDEEHYDYLDICANIDRLLPACMRMDYLKMINGVYLTRTRRDEIAKKIIEIMEDFGYEER